MRAVRFKHRLLVSWVILLAAGAAHAGYYSDSQKGWWWGDRAVEQKMEEKQEERVKQTPAPEREEQKNTPWVPPSLRAYSYEDVWNMHPDQFYEIQEAFKKKAVQNPTVENVKDYYEVQEIARKKALAFTNTAQYVWQKHPELGVAKDYPTATPGNLSRIAQISGERQRTLQANKDDYALIYFWRTGCPYCDEQDKILKWFQGQTGWIVKPVNIAEQPAVAARVGVETTPTIILIRKGSRDFFPVSAGVISADEVEDKTYRAVRLLNKEITPDEFSLHDFQRGGGFDTKGRKDWVK
jgi:conjugal transfer pilus assembly protein TraF